MENKKRLIDAKDFDLRVSQKKMSEVFPNWNELPNEVQNAVCKHAQHIHMLLETQPTIDAVEVVHGRWINTAPYRASNGNYNKAQECSVCHAYYVSPGNTPYSNHPYCAECGAKMDGDGNA